MLMPTIWFISSPSIRFTIGCILFIVGTFLSDIHSLTCCHVVSRKFGVAWEDA